MASATLAAPIGTRQHHYPAVTKTVPRMARAWAAKQLADLGAGPDTIEAARLIVSELVTNVALHAPDEADLTIGYEDGHAVITCADRGSTDLPQLDVAAADAESGRGLAIVHSLCASVWVRRRMTGPGKRIIACVSQEVAS